MADCTHDCGSCSSDCAERDLIKKPLESTHVKKVIGVISGKGGVGKSSVTSMLAVALNKAGYKVAVMDADITGPSIPRAFGVKNKAQADDEGIIPVETQSGIRLMSMNLLLENDSDPVVWRGPVIGGAVQQFWTDVVWGDVDYMLVDMPPGTGDVALTVFQSLPIDGIIIVTTPQELVAMIGEKAVKMAGMMDVPVLGMVENMSYYRCPDCGSEHAIFGISSIESIAEGYGINAVSRLPIDPKVAALCDRGMIETADTDGLKNIVDMLESLIDGDENSFSSGPDYEDGVGKIAVPVEAGNVCENFGHAPAFTVFRVKDGEVIGSYDVKNENQGHAGVVDMLWKNGVECVICGGIGEAALDMLGEAGIICLRGVKGKAADAIAHFIDGTLEFDAPEAPACGSHDGCGGCCGCH